MGILWNSKEFRAMFVTYYQYFDLIKSTPLSQQLHGLSEKRYIPAITINSATFRHSLPKVQVAILHTPEQICGFAQRVGYTGSRDIDLAIYRLKVKARNNLPTITLPGFFVIENGVFVDYDEWCQNREVK